MMGYSMYEISDENVRHDALEQHSKATSEGMKKHWQERREKNKRKGLMAECSMLIEPHEPCRFPDLCECKCHPRNTKERKRDEV